MTLALRLARVTCVSEFRFIPPPTLSFVRQCSSKTNTPKAKQHLKISSSAVRKNVKGYMFIRFFDYVKNYDQILEKNFPSAVRVYRMFFDGVKEFFADMKRFLKITRIANESPKGVKALNRKELELYLQMPKDMFKVAPIILLSSLPLVGYAAFPLAVWYPKTFLSSHFWSLQQKSEFQRMYITARLSHNRSVLRCLQAKLKSVENPKHKGAMKSILGQLGSGTHPSVKQLLNVKDAFANSPYSFDSLHYNHIKKLALIHGLSGLFFRRNRLVEHAYLLQHMDKAIMSEGGVHNMPQESIRNSCYLRGLNPSNLSNEEMVEWLRNWMAVSAAIKREHLSLYLHLPILLGYNHPNNWQLIYGKH